MAGVAALVVALVFGASLANAELVERGNLFVKFAGGIAPTKVAPPHNAPISVRVDGTVRDPLRRPAAGAALHLDRDQPRRPDQDPGAAGLPAQPDRGVELGRRRRPAGMPWSGTGRYSAGVAFPEQNTFPISGRILAFNTVVDGERAILAHVYGRHPYPNSRIFVFHIHNSSGTYGTVLTASLPASLNRNGYLKRIVLNLKRDFTYQGRKHSYLTAACGAPEGLTVGVFPFVRVGMTFADGRKLASTLIRTCTVRR